MRPLSAAVQHGHEMVVKLLLETSKVDINAKDLMNRTPLSRAGEAGREDILKLLEDYLATRE